MNDKEINYFIYARKSSEGEERQSLSIEGQLKDVQQIVKRDNLTVLDIITDTASAAIPYNRPGYTDMIRRIKKGEATGIIVWHVDRLIRNELEDGEFRWMLQTGIIKSVWTPNREYRSDDNALLISIEASMAAQYSRDLSVKVRRGLKQQYEKGQPCGVAPIGYLNTKFATHGTNYIVEDPDRFHLIRKGFDLLLSGMYDIPQILAKLNNEYGLRTRKTAKLGGGPVSRSTLYRTFTDRFYSGYFYRDGVLYKGAYKPMITVEEFDRVQSILGRPTKAKPHKHEFAFTGFIKCGACGCSVTATKKIKQNTRTGQYRTYVFYHCTKRKGAKFCADKHYTTEKEMEELIEQELLRFTITPVWHSWAIETIKDDYQQTLLKHSKLLRDVAGFEKKILQSLDTLIDLRISNEINEEKYIQKKAEKQLELIRVQEKRNRLESNVQEWERQLYEKLDFAKNAIEQFKIAEPAFRKRVCNILGWNWVLEGKKLTFSRREWFADLEDFKNYCEANRGTLDQIKTYTEYRESAHFEHILSTLRRARDHIRADNPTSERQSDPNQRSAPFD